MIPLNPALVKLMMLALAGTLTLTPIQNLSTNNAQVNKRQEQVYKKQKQQPTPTPATPTPKPEKKEIPNSVKKYVNAYETYKKLPITAGYKPGKNPIPQQEGRTPWQNYQEAWKMIKNELGF